MEKIKDLIIKNRWFLVFLCAAPFFNDGYTTFRIVQDWIMDYLKVLVFLILIVYMPIRGLCMRMKGMRMRSKSAILWPPGFMQNQFKFSRIEKSFIMPQLFFRRIILLFSSMSQQNYLKNLLVS